MICFYRAEAFRFRLIKKLKKGLTIRKKYAIIQVTCRRAYFFVQKNKLQYERREANLTGGAAK